VANPAGAKGSKGEREGAFLLTRLTGYFVRRKLGAGRKDDVGDLDGIPETVIQVANWADTAAAAIQKPRGAEQQRINAKVRYAATLVRFRGKENFRVVMTPEQFSRLLLDALSTQDVPPPNHDETHASPFCSDISGSDD
jgi:hypothetical protein